MKVQHHFARGRHCSKCGGRGMTRAKMAKDHEGKDIENAFRWMKCNRCGGLGMQHG